MFLWRITGNLSNFERLSICSKSRIKEILLEKNISIYRLEKITAISHNTMQTLMRADNKGVNLKTVLLICRGLGVTAEYFFSSPLFEDVELEVD